MKVKFSLIVILIVTVLSLTVFAAPQSEQEIPVFPGAERDYAAEEEYALQSEGWDEDEWSSVSSEIVKIYTVEAAPEEVLGFYINELGAEEG